MVHKVEVLKEYIPEEIVVWNDPLCTLPGFVAPCVSRAKKENIITSMKGNFPERNYTDQDALDDFMVVHWAWFESANETERLKEVEELLLFCEELIAKQRNLLFEAVSLLSEAVDRYPVETDPKLWTVRVRTWLEENYVGEKK
jgi:hypothetical protein